MGGWVVAKRSKLFVYLSLCALESRGRREGHEKKEHRVRICIHVRAEERDAFSHSCLSPSIASRSEASGCSDHAEDSALFLFPFFPKEKEKQSPF